MNPPVSVFLPKNCGGEPCVFLADWKNKMAALASDWLRHFQLLLWNRLTEFNETWQEARSQCPLPSLCFAGRSVNNNVRFGQFLKKVANCTRVHDISCSNHKSTFLVCYGCCISFIVSVHIQCQASIYTLWLCHGHSWRVRLAKQEAPTPPGHLVSPLVCRGPWMSTVVLYFVGATVTVHQFFCILHL